MEEELRGKLLVLEMLTMTSLGIVMASAENDPAMAKSRAILDYLRANVVRAADESGLSPEAKSSANQYADHILSQVLENLRLLRNGGQ
jgi:hypothetical protein